MVIQAIISDYFLSLHMLDMDFANYLLGDNSGSSSPNSASTSLTNSGKTISQDSTINSNNSSSLSHSNTSNSFNKFNGNKLIDASLMTAAITAGSKIAANYPNL